MKSFEELKDMEIEEIQQEFERNMEQIKQDHNMAVLMGTLGVSPRHARMYFDSVRRIREYENMLK